MDYNVSAAEFKTKLSEFLGRVMHKKEHFVITRHGRPVAYLTPIESTPHHLGELKGWVDDSDPFLKIIEDITSKRQEHLPRSWKTK